MKKYGKSKWRIFLFRVKELGEMLPMRLELLFLSLRVRGSLLPLGRRRCYYRNIHPYDYWVTKLSLEAFLIGFLPTWSDINKGSNILSQHKDLTGQVNLEILNPKELWLTTVLASMPKALLTSAEKDSAVKLRLRQEPLGKKSSTSYPKKYLRSVYRSVCTGDFALNSKLAAMHILLTILKS